MTKEEFIKKWVVAYESKEQQIEFANEMKADLEGIITAENTRLREALKIVEYADAGILACSILESVNPKLSAQEEAFFIAGFEECMKYLKLNALK